MKTKKVKVKAVRAEAYGILNAYGEFWTFKTFDSPESAQQYINNWARKYNVNMDKHKIVPVTITPLRKN